MDSFYFNFVSVQGTYWKEYGMCMYISHFYYMHVQILNNFITYFRVTCNFNVNLITLKVLTTAKVVSV